MGFIEEQCLEEKHTNILNRNALEDHVRDLGQT